MAAPLATEKVLRAALQALQRGGVISSGSDVAALEGVPNNATDSDISTILDGMTFGGVASATDVIRGDGDVNVFIDADNNNLGFTDQKFFRVAEDQSDPPVTDPDNELMTVSRFHEPNDWVTDLLVGPRTALATGDHHAVVRVGTSPVGHYGSIRGASNAILTSLKGLLVHSTSRIGIQADTAIVFASESGAYVRGGWDNPQNITSFHVGDHVSATQESLAFDAETVSSTPMYTIRPSYDGAAVRRTYFRGSNAAGGYRCFFSVGGKAGETWGDPNNFGDPTFMVVGDDDSNIANAAYVYDRKSLRNTGSEVVTIKSDATSGGTFYYLRVIDSTGTAIFSVTGDGTTTNAVNGPGGFTTGAADVAETVLGDAEYTAGTVLAIQGGLLTQTTDVAQANVAGVVATQPGMLLGTDKLHCLDDEFLLHLATQPGTTRVLTVKGDVLDRCGQYCRTTERNIVKIESANLNSHHDTELHLEGSMAVYEGIEIHAGITKQKNLNRMAITGIVPVWCSTVEGDILGNGETLVSGPAGTAVVDYSPQPGTIIGKAMGTLRGDGPTKAVRGLVDVLVNLQ